MLRLWRRRRPAATGMHLLAVTARQILLSLERFKENKWHQTSKSMTNAVELHRIEVTTVSLTLSLAVSPRSFSVTMAREVCTRQMLLCVIKLGCVMEPACYNSITAGLWSFYSIFVMIQRFHICESNTCIFNQSNVFNVIVKKKRRRSTNGKEIVYSASQSELNLAVPRSI